VAYDIFDCIDSDVKTSKPGLSDGCSNDGHVIGNVRVDNGNDGCGGCYMKINTLLFDMKITIISMIRRGADKLLALRIIFHLLLY
jgi:hypothetical protein